MTASYSQTLMCFSVSYWRRCKPAWKGRFLFWTKDTRSDEQSEEAQKLKELRRNQNSAFLRFYIGKLMLWQSDTFLISISAKLINKAVLYTAVSSISFLGESLVWYKGDWVSNYSVIECTLCTFFTSSSLMLLVQKSKSVKLSWTATSAAIVLLDYFWKGA